MQHLGAALVVGALMAALSGGLGALWGGMGEASAQERSPAIEPEHPLQLLADSVTYDLERGVVVASGHVEIVHGERILLADEVRYDTKNDTVVASGNLSLLDPDGDVIFADRVELTNTLREGFVTSIRILMADESRLAANGARRGADGRIVMSKAVFSACSVCLEHPEEPPLWQIKAVRVIHDKRERRIEYEDAFVEFFGVPIAYTPYFSHPDPTVKRQSGFLAPSYGSSTQLGLKLETPYYFALRPDLDATFSPLFTTREGLVLRGEYRQRFETGRLEASGSITRGQRRDENNAEIGGREIRGHLATSGRFAIDPTWRWGFDAERTTDDTYLRRFDIDGADTLTSNIFVEGFRGGTYASVNTYAFQGLRDEDDPGNTPIIFPEIAYHFVGEPGSLGGRFTIDANALILERSDSTDSRRLSLGTGWHLPYIAPQGDIYELHASLRGDLYQADDVGDPFDPTLAPSDGFSGRLYPQLVLDWRYPLLQRDGALWMVIEPITSVVLSPYGGNPDDVPNEDSVSFEFDDTNVLRPNRFTGLDRVEGGPRLNYGFRFGLYDPDGGYATAMFGQSLRVKADTTFADKTGLEDRRSDFVGRLTWAPSTLLDLSNRFRLDRDTFSIRRNEIKLSAGPKLLRANVDYVSLARELTADELTSREEINFRGRLQVTRYWAVDTNARRDLSGDGDTLDYGVGIMYEDECFIFSSRFERDFTADRDIQPSTSLSFKIRLKHLG